jgi:hypothetical protein
VFLIRHSLCFKNVAATTRTPISAVSGTLQRGLGACL